MLHSVAIQTLHAVLTRIATQCSDQGMGNSAQPQTVAEILELIVANDGLAVLGITPNHFRTLKARNSIPAERDLEIVDFAKRKGLPIDFELLARLRARQPQQPAEAAS